MIGRINRAARSEGLSRTVVIGQWVRPERKASSRQKKTEAGHEIATPTGLSGHLPDENGNKRSALIAV